MSRKKKNVDDLPDVPSVEDPDDLELGFPSISDLDVPSIGDLDVPSISDLDLDVPSIGDLDVPSISDLDVPTTDDIARDLGLQPPLRRRTRQKRLNPRQRAFARAIAAGMPRYAAQLVAGYKPNRKHALLLMAQPLVRAEIERQRGSVRR